LIDDYSQIQKVPHENLTDDYIYHETEQPTTVKNKISIYERDKLKNQQHYQSWCSRSERKKKRIERRLQNLEEKFVISSDNIISETSLFVE
jgi:hypothetical protein